jgi:uncharacterized protein (DUF362 family)
VVPSDAPELSRPIPRGDSLDAAQILGMARRAVDLVGGMAAFVPDTARTVLLKPNIVKADPPGTGVTTDPQLVRAVALLVHEVAPRARILIAEGSGGWVSPALQDCTKAEIHPELLIDGFEVGGYRRVASELQDLGVEIDCLDLNFGPIRTLQVPGGGLARDEYDLPAAVLDADAWINLPVAKTHGSKVTCCMKNHFGLLPGTRYGWSKNMGTPGHPGIPHTPAIVDEAWVDLWTLTRVDLNVVDLIRGTEAGAFSGAPRRSNIVVAGRDPVATDLVVARLMGFNPDDFEFAELARQRGMGPGSIDGVEIRGGPVERLISRYKKAGVDYGGWGEWADHADYGMTPRRWSLLGPLPADHAFTGAEIAALDPAPGKHDWSEVVFFGSDKIDLDKQFDDPIDCAVYAFTRFSMPQADSVRYWAGSDEDLQVWIDGEPVFRHEGRRRHQLGQDRLPGYLTAGEHRLLVRAGQGRGGFDFSLDICEPLDDRLYAGNTYPGLRWFVTRQDAGAVGRRVASDDLPDELGGGNLEPYHEVTFAAEDPLEVWRTRPDSLLLPAATPHCRDLVGLLLERAGRLGPEPDTTALACIARLPFGLVYIDFTRQQYAGFFGAGPEPVRILRWLGLDYGLSHGFGGREAGKSVQGWLAQGRVPIVGLGDGWALATGYRPGPKGAQVRLVAADTVLWRDLQQPWDGPMPGGERVSCPVVVQAEGGGVALTALTDTVARVALETARRERFVFDRRDWGEHYLLAGLAGWDAWVIEWERQPWTPAWARQPEVRMVLSSLRQQYLGGLAEGRELAGRYFEEAGQQTGRPLLSQAGAGYRQTAGLLRDLADRLPEAPAPADGAADPDQGRLDGIAAARPLLAQAREAERQALDALRQHLAADQPLPAVALDPLRHKDRGRKLLTWHTDYSQGVYDLTVRGDSVAYVLRDGKASQGARWELLAPPPREAGWQVVVEVVTGHEFYRVLEQPTAANDWAYVLRLDENFNFDGLPTDLILWAIPQEQ